ncbi:MAG TPA: DUF1801 domain-containing protein [Thermoanaerobaculia bacterium]|nr:DUF1801 domain-containing protein [Thermoanaerobaculia bacterium]
MAQSKVESKAESVDDYINSLPEDRRETISKLRKVLKKNLPKGYRERLGYGMITYGIPLETFPDTYNGQPLCYVALASQKNHIALYLMSAYGDPAKEKYLQDEFKKAGKKLDKGKSCIRFKKLEDLPLDAIATVVAATPPSELIAQHEAVHGAKRKKK